MEKEGAPTVPAALARLHRIPATAFPLILPTGAREAAARGLSLTNIRGLITRTNRPRACRGSGSEWERVGVGEEKHRQSQGSQGKHSVSGSSRQLCDEFRR